MFVHISSLYHCMRVIVKEIICIFLVIIIEHDGEEDVLSYVSCFIGFFEFGGRFIVFVIICCGLSVYLNTCLILI